MVPIRRPKQLDLCDADRRREIFPVSTLSATSASGKRDANGMPVIVKEFNVPTVVTSIETEVLNRGTSMSAVSGRDIIFKIPKNPQLHVASKSLRPSMKENFPAITEFEGFR